MMFQMERARADFHFFTLPLSPEMRRLATSIALLLALAAPAAAHPVPFSYVDLHLAGADIDGSIVVHVYDAGHELSMDPAERLLDPTVLSAQAAALERLLAARMQVEADGHVLTPTWLPAEPIAERQSVRLHVRYSLARVPGVVAVHATLFPYDPQHQTFLNIYEHDALRSQSILDVAHARFEYYSGTRQGVWAVVSKFVPAGIHHILIGPDHLLFLIGLLLLGGSMRQLALVVTSFTVAHSITLSLAALNLVTPPGRIIEPAIALSIVYVGFDNLLVRGGRDVRVWIAFTFGFIHGFGFANVLREMDLPARALGWSLFSFNVGVEIGQLLVVIAVASALGALRARSELLGRRLAFAGSIVVIAAGAFWFVQRVFFV
jgi:hydrogenase/urease accessory protein HupE